MGIRGLISARAEKAALAVWRRGGILSTQPFERTAQLMDGSVMRHTRDIGSGIGWSRLEGKPIGLEGSSTGLRV